MQGPFEGIVSDKSSSELSDQKRIPILSWNVGPMRETAADSVEGSFHVIMVHLAETVCHEIITNAEQRFHIYHCADHLILFHKSTFEPEGVKIPEEIPGTLKQDSFGRRYLLVKSRFRRRPKEGSSTCTAVSAHPSNTTANVRDVAKLRLGWLRKVAEKKLQTSLQVTSHTAADRERGKAKKPDEGIRRLLRLHANKKR